MKTFIKNKNGEKICVVVEGKENKEGLVFVMHGLGGTKDQAHVRIFIESFLEKGFICISFDTRNTFGESEGNYEDANITNYYKDLEEVIKWSKSQEWYQEPFILIGHSLGGISTAYFAQQNPEIVKAVAPISTVVSGKLSLETYSKEELDEMNKSGWKINESKTKPGLIKKLRWKQHIDDRLRYNLLEQSDKLSMPVLLIVGERDSSTPPKHQKLLFKKLNGKKELHIIKDAPHTFRDTKHLSEIKQIIQNWIEKVNR